MKEYQCLPKSSEYFNLRRLFFSVSGFLILKSNKFYVKNISTKMYIKNSSYFSLKKEKANKCQPFL